MATNQIADIVNEWARQHLARGPIARDTETYNQAWSALPALIAALSPPPEPAPAPAPEATPAKGAKPA